LGTSEGAPFSLRFQECRTAMLRVIEHLVATIETLIYPQQRRCDRKK
jgi:hypothetical protein